jgi:hypothetical protein
MRIMAVGAEEVFFLPVPETGSPAMDSGFPIPQLGAVALTAELVGFLVIDQLASGSVKHVAVFGIVTVETPPILFVVFEHDVVVEFFQLSPIPVDLQIGMALGTGEDVLGKRRRRDCDLLLVLRILPGNCRRIQDHNGEN